MLKNRKISKKGTMKRLLIGLIVGLATISPAFAVLSPLDQSLRELKTILDSEELRQNLQTSEAIQDVWHVGNRYIITTENRQMVVEVHYLKQNRPGRQEFELQFSPAKPLGQ